MAVGDAMDGSDLCGSLSPIWLAVSNGRCFGRDNETTGYMAILHYLDDFIMLGVPGSQECKENKHFSPDM